MTRVARQVGVTLAELTAVLAILAILVVFAVPAGLDWWRRETVIVLVPLHRGYDGLSEVGTG